MTVEKLKDFIVSNIRTFEDVEIMGEGVAFHYTKHFDKIESLGNFLGAEIDNNLDQTQLKLTSDPATHSPGVVFAYLDEGDSREEGFGCDIVEVEFKGAVKATHGQEKTLGAPPTILILNTDIIRFTKL